MQDTEDDLALHRRLASGDRSAFDELYRRYAAQAYGLAYRVTGQQMLAQDVVHDAFMALWRVPEAFDERRGSFRTFFLSMVHHRGVDQVRREQRLRARTEKAANLDPLEDEDPADAVAEAGYLSVRRKEVREALTQLPAAQRQVLEMAYFDGKTQVQIAEELAIPLGTVKTRTLAAMRKLRTLLEEAPVIDHDAADELLAGYVLGSLTGADAEEADRLLDEHVPDCITCRGTLDAFRGVTGELGLVADPLAPPEPLLPRLERELAGGRRRRTRQWGPARMVAGAAAAVVLLGAVGLALTNDGGSGPSELLTKADLATVTDLASSPGTKITKVDGSSEVEPPASEVEPPTHDELYVMWTGVPAPDAGFTYRLWAMRGDSVTYLGDFLPDNGVVALRIAVDPATVDRLLITSEPLGSPPSQPVASLQQAG